MSKISLPTTPSQPATSLQRFIMTLYGPNKIGKSTWCADAERPIFIATEPGHAFMSIYKIDVSTWEDFLKACALLMQQEHEFRTIVIDTIDMAWRLCVSYFYRKLSITHESDLPFGKAYSLIREEFRRVIIKLAMLPMGIIFVANSETKDVEDRKRFTFTMPSLPDKAQKIITDISDFILLVGYETIDGNESRVLRTKPSKHHIAGDRLGMLPDPMPFSWDAIHSAIGNNQNAGNAHHPPINKGDGDQAAPPLGHFTNEKLSSDTFTRLKKEIVEYTNAPLGLDHWWLRNDKIIQTLSADERMELLGIRKGILDGQGLKITAPPSKDIDEDEGAAEIEAGYSKAKDLDEATKLYAKYNSKYIHSENLKVYNRDCFRAARQRITG